MKKTLTVSLLVALVLGALAFVYLNTFANTTKPIKIAINPWPGYALLHLAKEKKYFEQNGVKVDLIEINSLADIRRAFERGQVDVFTSTVSEVVEANSNSNKIAKIFLLPDFSNGGDVILGFNNVASMQDLKGKKVAVEKSSLGFLLLHRALDKHNLDIKDVQVVTLDQVYIKEELLKGTIDAAVTYPPFSIELLGLQEISSKTIFTSKEIPGEILDTVSCNEDFIKEHKKELIGVKQAWQQAYTFWQDNPAEANAIMAEETNIDLEEFTAILADIRIMSLAEQKELFLSKHVIEVIKNNIKILPNLKEHVKNSDPKIYISNELSIQ